MNESPVYTFALSYLNIYIILNDDRSSVPDGRSSVPQHVTETPLLSGSRFLLKKSKLLSSSLSVLLEISDSVTWLIVLRGL